MLFVSLSVMGEMQSCTPGRSDVPPIPVITEAVPVKVIPMKKSKDTAIVRASGILTTEDETVHAFRIGGVVNSVFVREGDWIRKGQVLASLDLTEVDAQVAQAQLNVEKAARDLQRQKNLYRDSVVTLEQLQNAQTNFDLARQQVTAAKFNRRYAMIRAREDGYVLKKFVNGGEVVGVGDPVLVTNAPSGRNWILKVGVSARQWAILNGNEKAAINLDAFPDRNFDAFVFRKSERNDPQSGLFTVELKLQNTDARLATGVFGTARIQTKIETEFWAVPYEAVLDANGEDGFVFVARNDGKTAVKQAVKIQSFNDSYIALSHGLAEGDTLIVSGSAYLEDWAPISIVN